MFRKRWLLLAALSACGGSTATCPNDLPSSCPSPAPAYADVAPVFERNCSQCHAPGGIADSHQFETYAEVYPQRTTILSVFYGCIMPPDGGAPVSSDDRRLLLSWLVCHAPP